MQKSVELLGTHPTEQVVDAQPCILPLVVLFSIAAQENRASAGRFVRGYPVRPRMMVPMPSARMGTPYARRPVVPPMATAPGAYARRRMYY